MEQPTFSLKLFPREALRRYIMMVDSQSALESDDHIDPDRFAIESILLHGGDPDPKDVEDIELVKVHKGLARSYLNSSMVGAPSVVIANMEVCGDRMKPRWRTSDHAKATRTIPAGRYSKKMVELWELFVEIGLRELKNASPRTKRVFCAAVHDGLVVIRPMLQGNMRAAQLLEQPVRLQLGLRPRMYRKADEIFHDQRISSFQEVLAPVLKKYNFT